MGINTKVYLPAKARISDVSKVIGKLLRSKKISIESCIIPECAKINIIDGKNTEHHFLYHFEFDSEGNHGIVISSTARNIAIAKGLVDFFGGKIDFNNCDCVECDYYIPEQLYINAEDGDEWDKLQYRINSIEPITLHHIKECNIFAAYKSF